MASLFAPRTTTVPVTETPRIDSSQQNQNEQAIAYAKSMMERSGGDARAAFYMAAKEKGIDPDAIINQVKTLGDPKALLSSALSNNPMLGSLMSLMSMSK